MQLVAARGVCRPNGALVGSRAHKSKQRARRYRANEQVSGGAHDTPVGAAGEVIIGHARDQSGTRAHGSPFARSRA